jgi:hypothetical protein
MIFVGLFIFATAALLIYDVMRHSAKQRTHKPDEWDF